MIDEPNSAGLLVQERHEALDEGIEASACGTLQDDLRALQAVVEGTARGTGQEFFQSLVRHKPGNFVLKLS